MSKGSPYILDRRLATEPGDAAAYPYDRVEDNRVFEERAVTANMSVQGVKLNDWATRIVTLEGGGGSSPTGDAVFFNTLVEVGTTSIAADVDVIAVGGYADAGDCPFLSLKRVATEPLHYGKKQSADGAWWEYIFTGTPIFIEWFGGKADYWITPADASAASTVNPSKTDNWLPIKKAYETLFAFIGYAYTSGAFAGLTNYSAGPTIQLSYGGYYVSDTITFDRGVCFQGMGHGYYHNNANSRLYFPAGKKGIVLNSASATGGILTQASASVIRNIFMSCAGHGGVTTEHGIELNSPGIIEHCTIHRFGGHGIDIVADIASVPSGNANAFYLNHCYIYENAMDGVYCQGGDVNAGIGLSLDVSNNGRWGINDNSFLGNTWVACHAAYNGNLGTSYGGAYNLIGGNSRSVLLGCYSEGGQPRSVVASPGLSFGGLHGAGITVDNGPSIVDDSIGSHVEFYAGTDVGDDLTVRTRYRPNYISSVWAPEAAGFAQHYLYPPSYGALVFRYGDSGGEVAYTIATNDKIQKNGRGEYVPVGKSISFPNGIWIGGHPEALTGGEANCGRFLGISDRDTIPLVYPSHTWKPGAYAKGDTLINASNSATTLSRAFWGEVNTQDGVYTAKTWTLGANYALNDYVVNSAGRYYKVTTDGAGVVADEPVHVSGAVTGADGYGWTFIDDTPTIWRRFGPFMGDATVTADDPIFNTVQTWNNAAVTFRGLKHNIVITAAATASMLLDLQVAGATKFNVGRYGDMTVTSGSLTSTEGSQPVLTATQTWNDVATTFKGIDLNITNTTSAAASKLLDLRVGGTTKFNTDVDGDVVAAGVITAKSATATTAGGAQAIGLGTTAALGIYYGSGAPTISAGKGSLYLRSDGSGVSDRMYVNTDAGTTWTAVTTAA
jgi:hypothetical protein